MSIGKYPKVYLYKRIVEAKLFIDRHYLDNIEINIIACQASLSKFHFLRLFKETYGITLHQYLTTLKIEKARRFLQDGSSISNACYSLGFASLSSFNRLLKRHLEVNPSAYSVHAKYLKNEIAIPPLKYIPQCFVEYMGWDK